MVQQLSGNSFAAGIVDAMRGTYDELVQNQLSTRLTDLMQLDVPTKTREARYAYWETPPGLTLWEQGSAAPRGGARSISWTVGTYNWGREIGWHEDDREDDVLQGMIESAERAGESAAYLAEQFAMDILLGNASTLPSIPTAPDGGVLCVATVGGVNRFGVSGGNIISSPSGVASVDAVLTDYFACRTRWAQMTHKGQRLVPDPLIRGGITILAGPQNEKVFTEAFLTSRIVSGSNGSTPANVVLEAGHKVNLWFHPAITTNAWWAILSSARQKPLFEQVRMPLRETIQTVETDPSRASTGLEAVTFKKRSSAGVNLPWQIIKVAN